MLGHAPDLAGNKSNVTTNIDAGPRPASDIDSSYAWMRLAVALALGTIGSVGMWSFVVALPAVQADFGVARGEASLPFTLTMIGFGVGGIVMGRLADRFGIVLPVVCGAIALGVGYVLSGVAGNLWQFALAQGLIGFGSVGDVRPADDRHLALVRRAAAASRSRSPPAATISPARSGRRSSSTSSRPTAGATTQIGIGMICIVTMLPLALLLRRRAPRASGQRLPARPRRASSARSAFRRTR